VRAVHDLLELVGRRPDPAAHLLELTVPALMSILGLLPLDVRRYRGPLYPGERY
jgi:hypothetical protein